MGCSDASHIDVQGDICGIWQESGVNTVAISSGGTPCGGCPERDDEERQDDRNQLHVVVIVLEVHFWETGKEEFCIVRHTDIKEMLKVSYLSDDACTEMITSAVTYLNIS